MYNYTRCRRSRKVSLLSTGTLFETIWPSNMNCYCHCSHPDAIIIEIFNRLCSFPSPPSFDKPCDIWDTDRPFCYTRLKEAYNDHKFSFIFFNTFSYIKKGRNCMQDGNYFGGNKHWGYCQVS